MISFGDLLLGAALLLALAARRLRVGAQAACACSRQQPTSGRPTAIRRSSSWPHMGMGMGMGMGMAGTGM